MYGVPSKCDFCKDDSQGLFLKLPLNTKIKEIKEVTEGLFKQLGENFTSNEFKEDSLGSKKRNTHTNL